MEQHTTKNFDVIGLCSKMQTLSWAQENSLLDGICYDIDFSQDFQSMYVEGLLITDVPVARLIKAIDDLTSKTANPSAGYFPQKDNGRYDEEMSPSEFALLIKKASKQIDQKEKWEKRYHKVKAKDAWYNFARAYEDITGEVI